MSFDQLNDEELAKQIQAGIAELKARHAKQEAELAQRNAERLKGALSKTKKAGRKPKVNTIAA